MVLGINVPAHAAEIKTSSTISHVTVFPRGASVTRMATLDLPAGDTVLTFAGLPNDLDPTTLQVAGSGSGRLAIGAVDIAMAATQAPLQSTDLSKRIKALQDQRDGQQVVIDTLSAKWQMMLDYAKTSPAKLTLDNKPLDISQWGVAFDSLAAGLAKTGDELRLAKAKGKEIDDAINSLTQPKYVTAPLDRLSRSVQVHVTAAEAGEAQITVTYLVADAGWQAVYEARLASAAPAHVSFVRRAIVSQTSGEDWQDVPLGVSSVSHFGATQPPQLATQIVDFPSEPIVMPMRAATKNLAVAKDARIAAPRADFQAAQLDQASVSAGNYQVDYTVQGKANVPGNGTSGTFVLMQDDASVSLSAKVTPAINLDSYLSASMVNHSGAAILPGQVNLYRDGVFVGHASVPVTPAGEPLVLGFGIDPDIQVSRVPVNIKGNEISWLGQTKSETRDYETKIRNLHSFPVQVEVVDRVPVSENAAITVETLPQTAPTPSKDSQGRRGILHWQFDLAAGAEKDIRLAWRIKSPGDKQVVVHGAPGQP
ncbi:MAG: mucoidy inhibitor MuiA family protein [Hyphomicrobiales bacterium]|nr:mucoidy inhibitor MuiA family protein [Hyphomicrobiales bacterium]MDE2114644.1 mucoidy inhibitor MuiA family protein [Hyphomicrobiales bacterium]